MAAKARKRGLTSRTAFAVVAVGLAVVVLLLAAAAWLFFASPQTDLPAGKSVQIEIPSGASTRTIAEVLSAAGVIRNQNMFRLQSRLARADGDMRPGVYDLRTGMPNRDVIEQLKAGPPIEYVSVTVPEGFTAEQIAARLEKRAGVSGAEFLTLAKGSAREFAGAHPVLSGAYNDSLEGYLFPKTYRVQRGADARQVVEMMLTQFDEEFAQVDVSAAEQRGLSSAEIVTLASMIEREAQLDKERPLVSSVIYNRLAANRLLEIDATIEYVLPGNRFRLLNRHLRIDSPYNTYRYKGLPPGPISNPGLASLKAAAAPADTQYMYYVLTGKDGTHTFTVSRTDFLKAKAKSKQVFGR